MADRPGATPKVAIPRLERFESSRPPSEKKELESRKPRVGRAVSSFQYNRMRTPADSWSALPAGNGVRCAIRRSTLPTC